MKIPDITGNKYGRLTVIEKADHKDNNGHTLWKCLCDCQIDLPEEERQYVYTTKSNLERGASDKPGGTSSCGCYAKEIRSLSGKKNRVGTVFDIINNEYGVGYTTAGNKFMFDIEDYEAISEYTWTTHPRGYVRALVPIEKRKDQKYVFLHRLVMEAIPHEGLSEIDHINGDTTDNRKINLRWVTRAQNVWNTNRQKNNKTGYPGIYRIDRKSKNWSAYISVNGDEKYLGSFFTLEAAILERKAAEDYFYGEYAFKNRPNENSAL